MHRSGISRTALVWLATGVLGFLSGCADEEAPAPEVSKALTTPAVDWRIFRGNSALQGVAAGSLGSSPELAWTFPTEGAILSSPVIADGTVYVGSIDGSLYAIDLETGVKRWAFMTEDAVEAPPLILEGRVFVGSSDCFFYAVDAETGKQVWKFETGDTILGGANWLRSKEGALQIIFGSYDTSIYCLDAGSGSKVWSYETSNYINGTPAILDGRIIFGGCDAFLRVLSAEGKELKDLDLGADCHVAGSVALAGNRAYLGHYGNEFVCVDLEECQFGWIYPSPRHAFFSSPAIGRDRVVFGGRDKQLHCVGLSDGKPIWTFPTRRKIDGSPVICGDKVVFGSGDGRLYIVALEDGKEIWKYDIGRSIFSSPAVAAGFIVVGSDDKSVYAFRSPPDGHGR